MHEMATLVHDAPELQKKAGDLVTIDVIEKSYKTSAAAKVNKYKCANEHCGVSVIAVIPNENKPGRKKSPCAYFTAKPISHVVGCSRQPTGLTSEISSDVARPNTNPNRRKVPTIWVDPIAGHHAHGTIGNSGDPIGNPGGNTRPSQIRGGASGKSESRSQMVRRFAVAWKSMSVQERQNTPLSAPWNRGGNYFSGFLPLQYYQKVDVTALEQHIVVGTLFSIYKGTTGYVLTLKEKDSSGLELKIWVQSVAFEKERPGKSLEHELSEIQKQPRAHKGREVYVFGKFRKQTGTSTGTRSWLSLPVTHPSMIWISDIR